MSLLERWSKTIGKLREQMRFALMTNNHDRAKSLLWRFNAVARHQRARNIANGMPKDHWVDLTMDQTIKSFKERGLL